MRAWLEKNKIIFETLVAASLTVMGVLVSVAAVVVSVSANKLASRQYDLARYGAEPVFAMEWIKGKYIITNSGAEIHNVRYQANPRYHMIYTHYDTEEDDLNLSYSC